MFGKEAEVAYCKYLFSRICVLFLLLLLLLFFFGGGGGGGEGGRGWAVGKVPFV